MSSVADDGGHPAGADAGAPEATGPASVGKSVVFKGELNGSEDLVVHGYVEGKIEVRDHTLTIAAGGRVKAEVYATAVVVFGELTGNISAADSVDIRAQGSVDGDIVAPQVAIAPGAHFRGSIDMQRKGARPGGPAIQEGAVRPPAGGPPSTRAGD